MKALIVGSGPAAAGAALALAADEKTSITVVDIGETLEPERDADVRSLAHVTRDAWDPEKVGRISVLAEPSSGGGLPEKRTYGSDYPFRNVGQLDGIHSGDRINPALVSGAYGGYSNVWGTQVMPFVANAFRGWPFGMPEMVPHYRAVLEAIPFAAEPDDLADVFPLLAAPTPLPAPSERTRLVLEAYGRNRSAVNRLGILLGKARLALKAGECIRCGLCMTGCPYGLMYSAAQTFDSLRQRNRVTYHGGLLATHVEETETGVRLIARELESGATHDFEADRVFVACGGVGSARLIAASLGLFDRDIPVIESRQFVMPTFSIVGVNDPRGARDFTLNQFNMLVSLDTESIEAAQVHFYTYDPSFVAAFPRLLGRDIPERLIGYGLRHLTVGLGYLPSWASPKFYIRARPASDGGLPDIVLSIADNERHGHMMRSVLARIMRAARHLDMYPALPVTRLAPAGKSYHWGGSFPHGDGRTSEYGSDVLGRVRPWRRIHVVDGSVLPSIPATTFTLTVMANAHRIATAALETDLV